MDNLRIVLAFALAIPVYVAALSYSAWMFIPVAALQLMAGINYRL